jgi:hypothetical protein
MMTRTILAVAVAAIALPLHAQSARRAGDAAKTDSILRAEQLSYRREMFAFAGQGRRDPFVSLMSTGVLRPTMADLSLVAVAYASRGNGRSVAIFRDKQTKEQYRVVVGQALGRMRVASIDPRRVTFTIDEFGVSRQEIIAMGDSTRMVGGSVAAPGSSSSSLTAPGALPSISTVRSTSTTSPTGAGNP